MVHGLEDGERFPDGNGPPEMGLDVVVNGGPIRGLLIHGDPDGSTQWTTVIGSMERGDEVLSVDMVGGKSRSHGGRKRGDGVWREKRERVRFKPLYSGQIYNNRFLFGGFSRETHVRTFNFERYLFTFNYLHTCTFNLFTLIFHIYSLYITTL